ncbi:MAG: hypothetical protein ACHWZW_04695 [Spirulina sp.]
MRPVRNPNWHKNGMALLWNAEKLATIAAPDEVYSLRQFLRLQEHWPDDLPSSHGNTLVVAGLDGALDSLSPDDGQQFLEDTIQPAILSFQDEYEGQAGLLFWLPQGQKRIKHQPATNAYTWACGGRYNAQTLAMGRALWAGAATDAGHLLRADAPTNTDLEGPDWIGLYLERIS